MDSIQAFLIAIGDFINGAIIPFLFAIALLFFLYNAALYFIIKGSDSKAREQAKQQALYGIAAFVIITSLWGIVNVLVYGLDLGRDYPIQPDYIEYGGTGPAPNSGNTYQNSSQGNTSGPNSNGAYTTLPGP